jgi:hypothetical protein
MRCCRKTAPGICSGEYELSVGRRLCDFHLLFCLHDGAAKVADVLSLDGALLRLGLCHDGARGLVPQFNSGVSHCDVLSVVKRKSFVKRLRLVV